MRTQTTRTARLSAALLKLLEFAQIHTHHPDKERVLERAWLVAVRIEDRFLTGAVTRWG